MDANDSYESGEKHSLQRSFDFYETDNEHLPGRTIITGGLWNVSFRIVTAYDKFLQKIGFFLANRRPLGLLLFSLFFFVASCFGFIRLSVEQLSRKQFIVADGQTRIDLQYAAQFFPLLDSRQEQIIVIPKHNRNILDEECLKEAVLVHQTVLNISNYRNLCFKKSSILPTRGTEIPDQQTCVVSNPLDLAGANFEHLSNLSIILASEKSYPRTTLSDGQSLETSYREMLGNFRVSNKTKLPTVQAEALRISYFIRKTTSDEEDQQVLDFETSFEHMVSSIENRLKCSSLFYRSGKSTNIALQQVLKADMRALYLSFLAVIVLALFFVCITVHNISCLTAALFLLSTGLLPFICSAGIVSMAGISFSPTAVFIPFLLLGKATSDLALFLNEWEQLHNVLSLEYRVTSCIARVGTVQVFSALCGTILVGVAIKSSFEVISRFFLVTLIPYVLVSTASFLITAALMRLLESKLKPLNTFCGQPCDKRVRGKVHNKMRNFLKNVPRLQTSFGGKVFSLFILICFISFFVLSALYAGERTGATESLNRQNNNFNKFSEARQKFFGKQTDVSIVFSQETDYSQKVIQDQMLQICKTLGKASYSQTKPVCWITALSNWARNGNKSCLNSQFYRCLKRFLNTSHSVSFRQDVRFHESNPRSTSLASRFHVTLELHNQLNKNRESLEKLRGDLKRFSRAKPVSKTFFKIEDLSSLERETVLLLIIATVVVFVTTLLSSTSFRISICLTLLFGLLIAEIVVFMEVWAINLNHITFISLYFTVVLAQNFSVQVAHSFIFSDKLVVRERGSKALCSVGWPVFVAAFLEISGSISLGFIFPSLQNIFSRLIPLVLALGLIHALVILPPAMTLIFGFRNSFDVQKMLLKQTKQKRRKMSIEIRYIDTPLRATSKRSAISIVGISCRFPGANSKNQFWNLLEQGRSSVTDFPQNRTEEHEKFFRLYHHKRFVNGRHCAVRGSYLEDILSFDNTFFGLSDQEARGMDPQQRMLLEVVYEAIEDAGMRLEDLQRCQTGVFLGVMNLEYSTLIVHPSNYNNIDQFSSTGITASILANRVSFCLNLTGPSIAVDTACSSSLTALKLACDHLVNGDCDIAIVCAPNIILSHAMQIVSSMAGLLAPDGCCKSFDASGDGYGRGEGFAAIVLKLSGPALKDKDDAYCEIIACGMNNDGHNAVPMTAPSAKTQAALFRMVLDQAGLNPEEVDYLEAHGTGTAIGDVVEVTSIGDVYTRGTTRQLKVGSVKSNLNHTESTSGLAGLIKVALMIKNKRFVPTVNIRVLNPKLKLNEKGLIVQQTKEPWVTEGGKPRIGAVNSFGYGGTNVHVLVQEVAVKPSLDKDNGKSRRPYHILTLTAPSQEALKRMALLYAQWLEDEAEENATFVENLCYSLNERRSQFSHRLALTFEAISEASKILTEYAYDSVGVERVVVYGEINEADPKLVFLFGGQGSQWYAMGRQLIEMEPVFKNAFLTVHNVIKDLGKSMSLLDEIMASEEKSRIADNSIAQPATFAIQYATAKLLMSWRIYPSAVLGHSLGEIAAACVAGIITLKEAVQLVLARSSLQDQCPSNGSMAALGVSEERARALLDELKLTPTLCIAAVNDAESVTVSGDVESVEALGRHIAIHEKDTFWRVLGTKRAFHSSHMEFIKGPFQAELKRISLHPKPSKIPVYSTVIGGVLCGQEFNNEYWWRNIRCPVQFYSAMRRLFEDGYKQVVEISTQPILAHYVKKIASQVNLQDQALPIVLETLPRKRLPVKEQCKSFLLNTVCKLYTLGFPIDWTCVQQNPSAKFVRSLTYPWLKNRLWYRERPPETIIQPPDSKPNAVTRLHPFLEKVNQTTLYSGLHCWETEIDLHRFPDLRDHALIQGTTVMPGAAYLEMAFAMAMDQFVHVAGLELTDVKLLSLLTLPDTQVRLIRLRLQKTKRTGEAEYNITCVQEDHAEIYLSRGKIYMDLLQTQKTVSASNLVGPAISELMEDMERMPNNEFRELTEKFGFKYGPSFSIIKEAWKRKKEGLCLIDIKEAHTIQEETERYLVHPSILDACLQSCFIPLASSLTGEKSVVPVGFKSIALNDFPSTNQLYCHVTEYVSDSERFDVTLMSPTGCVLLTMTDLRVTEITSSSRQLSLADLAYDVQWSEAELTMQGESSNPLHYIVLKDSSHFSNYLVSSLQAREVSVISVNPPDGQCFDSEVQETIKIAFAEIPAVNSSSLRVVNLWPMDTSLLPDHVDVIEQAQQLAFGSSAFLIRLLIEKELMDSRLFLVTELTQLLDTCDSCGKGKSIPWGATVWGLKRTANLEEVNLRVTAVDLCNKEDKREVDSLLDEILGSSIEDEVAFRNGRRFISRLVRSELHQDMSKTITRKESKNKRHLYLSTAPSSKSLCLREQCFPKTTEFEVIVEVSYCWTPSETLFDVSKPNGCVFVSGEVTDLPGSGEITLQIGDNVCGVIPSGRVARFIPIPVTNVFLKPSKLTMKQATYLPASLALAYHTLQKAAAGATKQKLLIHEANRGPGPATVLLGNTLGHRVFCTISDTCSSSTKSLLTELGAESVKRQSSPAYNDDLNDPFDAVVFFNPPFPNVLHRSGPSLKRGGKVIILSNDFEGNVIFPANKNLKYERENILDILRPPSAFEELSMRSMQILETKGVSQALLGLKIECLDLVASIKAFNEFLDKTSSLKDEVAQSSNISFFIQSLGTFEEAEKLHGIPVLPQGLDECGLKENKSYLVAGGVRGFGFEVARWMAENGAKSIVLLGRSVPSDSKIQEVRKIEKRTGATIHIIQVDISNPKQMSSLGDRLQSLPNVAGIVHTAMILRDEFIKELKLQSFNQVMGPKIKGSLLLHQMSLEMDLDFFVMFSSMASIVGNIGQSSYAACNAFQDSLAQYRRNVLHLPGLAINWGPISGAGVMERETGIAKLLTLAGLGFVDAKEGVKHMVKVLTEEPGRCQISLFNADWPVFLKSSEGLKRLPRLSIIRSTVSASDKETSSTESLAQRIVLEKDGEKRAELINEYVSVSMTELLTGNLSSSETDLNASLYSYGVDSTTALSLKMHLEKNLQVSFEVFYFMQPDTTPLKLARDLTAKMSERTQGSLPSNEQSENDNTKKAEHAQAQATEDVSPITDVSESKIQVVPLYTPEGSAIKFFCVHPSHRYALSLMPIAAGFQGQKLLSFYGLGFTDPAAVSADWGGVRELATHYVQLISREQRHGPYFLGGYSYGGLLAYEMASLLTEQNQRVEFVAMIDTFPWTQPSSTVAIRLPYMQGYENSQRRHVELQFENYLRKLAIDSLKMTSDEYHHMREENTKEWIIEELEKRAFEKGVANFNLRTLRESLLKDQIVASRTHVEWQPTEFRYRGPLTFLKCQDACFSPISLDSSEKMWGQLVDGGITVLVCPGNHYSMSESPNATVTGSILATALAFKYRLLFPEFPRHTRTFSQRRAVEKLSSGVAVFLHSKRGRKKPHFGELHFQEDLYTLQLTTQPDEGETRGTEKTKKIINLKDLLMVQPGTLVANARKYAGRKRRVGAHHSGNLRQIASVITRRRVYNLEFTDYSDLKSFYNMIEAVFTVQLLSR